MTNTNDLTKGNIYKQILIFALPIFAGQLLQNLYNSVDSIVVGRMVSNTALAAVSSSSDITILLTGFFTGLSAGSGVLFARYFGAKDYEKLSASIHTTVLLSIILGVSMSILGIILSPSLLRLIACPEDVFLEANNYLKVYFIGVAFTSIYNIGEGVLRAVGDSKHPFYYLAISSLLNIVLDIINVGVFKMGVMGVAFATICAQFLSVFMVFSNLFKSEECYGVRIKDLKIDGELLKEVISLGIPAAIQSSLISISNLFVQRYINVFGSDAMAGIGAAKKVDKFCGIFATALGRSIAIFVSQNMGANDHVRAVKGIRACLLLSLFLWLATGIPLFVFSETFISIFTKNALSIEYGSQMVRVLIGSYYIQYVCQILTNCSRGFGYSSTTMLFNIFGMIVARQIFLAISMSIDYNIMNVFVGYPVGWLCATILIGIHYLLVVRKRLVF